MSQLPTGASHSKRNRESSFYYCDGASCFQLQQSNPSPSFFKFCSLSCYPVPVVSLASLLHFSFFFIPILFISCSTLPFPNLFASGTLRTAPPTVLINLLTNLRFSSRSWNSTRLWRKLWPSSWTASARLKHARKEKMHLLLCFSSFNLDDSLQNCDNFCNPTFEQSLVTLFILHTSVYWYERMEDTTTSSGMCRGEWLQTYLFHKIWETWSEPQWNEIKISNLIFNNSTKSNFKLQSATYSVGVSAIGTIWDFYTISVIFYPLVPRFTSSAGEFLDKRACIFCD